MQPKPGLKSSEFVIVLIVLAVSNVFAAMSPSLAENFPDNKTLQTALPMISICLAAIINVFVSVGWILARTSIKMDASSKGGFSHVGLLIFIPLLFSLAIMSGCAVEKDWVLASDATCNAISPRYSKYIAADTELSKAEKESVKLLLRSWRKRVDEWKKTLEMK